MTTINLYSGPLKRDIVQLAYEECGQAGYEFELTPEEYDSALRRMNAMLAEWLHGYGIDLGYNFPNYGNGSGEDESGIPHSDVQVVATYLALRVAPGIGKTMSADSKAVLASSWTLLRSRFNRPPHMGFARQTIVGAGNRRIGWRGPFFPVQQPRPSDPNETFIVDG